MSTPIACRPESGRPRDAWVAAAVVFVVALLARLPRVMSPWLVLDGDEAVVGLMAKHLLEGREFPVFFYGQSYGFSGLEAAIGAASFALLGVCDWALAFGMAVLWSVGAAFFALAAIALVRSPRAGLWIGLVYAVAPAWILWSVKARGGYTTAATFSAIALWLLVVGRHRAWGPGLVLGLVGGVVAQAQPLWGLGLVPFFAWAWWRGRWWQPVWWALGAAIVIVPLWLASRTASDFWQPVVFGSGFSIEHVKALPRHLYDHLGGRFYLDRVFEPTWPVKVASIVMLGLVALAVVHAMWRGVVRRDVVSLLLVVALAGTVVNVALLQSVFGRYLLPAASWLVLLVGYEARRWHGRRLHGAAAAVLLAAGVVASLDAWRSFPGDRYPPGVLRRTIAQLDAQGAKAAFVVDPLLQWQIAFYTRERIVCRFMDGRDRYPPHFERAMAALDRGEPCALIAMMWHRDRLRAQWQAAGLDPARVDTMVVEWPFALSFGVSRTELAAAGFAF